MLNYAILFMLLCSNLFLALWFPVESGVSTDLFDSFVSGDETTGTITANGEYNEKIQDITAEGSSSVSGSLAFFDPFFVILEILSLIVSLVVSLPNFLFNNGLIDYYTRFMIAVPTFFTYVYAFTSWIFGRS